MSETKEALNCPACGRPLKSVPFDGGIILTCDALCEPEMNDGASGQTVMEAYLELMEIYNDLNR